MPTKIYDKTDKGREEISSRKHQLAPRLRTLLLLVDGKHSGKYLLQKVAGLGLGDQSLDDLLNNGFIRAIDSAVANIDQAAQKENVSASNRSWLNSVIDDKTGLSERDLQVLNQHYPIPDRILPEAEARFQALYDFYSDTIRTAVGLRGYTLQLKVDNAKSIDDFRALRSAYLTAVLKAKGQETALDLAGQLDKLLSAAPVSSSPE